MGNKLTPEFWTIVRRAVVWAHEEKIKGYPDDLLIRSTSKYKLNEDLFECLRQGQLAYEKNPEKFENETIRK